MYNIEKIYFLAASVKLSEKFTLYYGKNKKPALKAEADGCSFFINSRYNPEKEAEAFAREHYTKEKDIFLYGIGLGYHVRAIADMLLENQKLYVLEFNPELLKITFENTDINEVLSRENVIFDIPLDYESAAKEVKEIFSKKAVFICHEPSLRVMPEEFKEIKEIFDTFIIKRRSVRILGNLLSDNEKENLTKGYENGGKTFFERFSGKRAVIVSAGPSLEINGPLIGKIKDAKVISVARALKYLKKIDVKPDFAIISDPKESVIGQLDLNEGEIPLFFLSTIHPSVEKYKGEKYILFEEFSDKIKEDDRKYCVETGGSVATTAMGLCRIMGFSEIILIGQDLCYHSEKTHSGENESFKRIKTGKTVLGIDGENYYSPPNLYEYLKWFRKFAAKHKEIKLINCTAKGAYIEGFEHRSINDFL